ncbi:hypothetical protein [Marixanthomonas ophiurae]|uniref:Uncharacterized protein n=1 Tax=Marixanthomonas ophiurae TaxID=387659 RepID=A0A3E1Q8F6_9FLAO|nr:hypothetical protein [Marixanthomonas ophiurae]RFN58411.1 hypothetical protein DZ858_14420 [Marixanthomonas ophiurae]
MKSKFVRIILLFIVSLTISSCSSWIEFDLKRYAFGFIITLVIGVIGLIIMAISGGNKNK